MITGEGVGNHSLRQLIYMAFYVNDSEFMHTLVMSSLFLWAELGLHL